MCLRGHEGRILGCPRDPPDNMGQLCERDMKGESQDVQGILWTAWAAVCMRGTPREDPGMSKGFSEQHGQLVERDIKGGSQDVLGILDPPKTERTRLDCLRSLGQL